MAARRNGRPREFDVAEAARKAMQVFWARGYDGASMDELTRVMGISKPSVYAAFGDKRGLFNAALDEYNRGPRGFVAEAMKLRTAKEAVIALLDGIVEISTHKHGAKGCLQTHAALACGPESEAVRDMLAQKRLAGEDRLQERLKRAVKSGELPAKTDTAHLAKYVATVANGITVQGASGASRKELKAVAKMAMLAWPE